MERLVRCSNERSQRLQPILTVWVASFFVFPVASSALSSNRAEAAQFAYVGGTENILEHCTGTLQLTPESLAFRCAQYAVSIPYDNIEIMQYRHDVGRRVRKLKLKWKERPPRGGGGNKNRYFTVVYRASGAAHAVVLEVEPDEMRPYLAEIDLKAGRRVDVERHEDYE